MKSLFLASSLCGALLLLSGCSALKPKTHAVTPRVESAGIRAIDATEVPPLGPAAQRQAEAMYDVLVGEFAGYGGELPTAVKYYLRAATVSSDPQVAKRAAQIALYARDSEAATKATARWVRLAPDDTAARRTLALLYLQAKKVDRAVDQFDALVRLAKGDPERGFYRVSRVLARVPDQKLALDAMARLVARHKNDPHALYAYSNLAVHAGDSQLALTTVQRALALKPAWPEASLLRARILMQQGKTDQAIGSMAALVKQHPDSRALRMGYGRLLAEAKQFTKAREQFEYLLRKSPKDPNLLYAVALLAMQDKHLNIANEYLHRLEKTGQRKQDAYFYLGVVAEAQGHLQRAIRWYRKVNAGARHVDAQIRVAMLLAKQGHLAQARKELHSVHPTNEDTAVRFYLAEVTMLSQAGRTKDAMAVVNEALARLPGNNDLLYARAMLAEKLGQLDRLEQDLKEILTSDPDNVEALNALGYTLADQTSRYKEAFTYIQKALRLSPNEPAIIDSMGWVQYRLGHLDKARDYLQRAYKLDKDSEIAAHLVEVLSVSGDHARARSLLQRALKRDPKSKALHEVAKRLKL